MQKDLINLISPGSQETQIYCTATTNKAAAVLADFTGESTKTIHSLLGLKVVNNNTTGGTSLRKTGNSEIIQDSIILIDEASYVDKHLLKIIRESTFDCKLLFIGDRYQLATVGSKECPVFTDIPNKGILTGSQRFSHDGPIAALAAQYRATIDGADFPMIQADGDIINVCTNEEFRDEIHTAFQENRDDVDHAKIIAWSNNKVHQYNGYVRSLHTKEPAFMVGERIVTNKPIVMRTPAGRQMGMIPTETMLEVSDIREAEEHGCKGWWVTIGNDFHTFQPEDQIQVDNWMKELAIASRANREWSEFFRMKEFFSDLRPIHSATVYKAQGSTYSKVFIDLQDMGRNTQWETFARMMHVAATRPSQKIYLNGLLPTRYGGVLA
jgi:ATP-dependent exoDNAse (exonuclease V) alpha subunit